MKVTELKYTRRYNTGEYEFEEFTATATVDEDDDTVETIKELKDYVAKGYDGGDETEEKPVKKKSKKKQKEEDEDAGDEADGETEDQAEDDAGEEEGEEEEETEEDSEEESEDESEEEDESEKKVKPKKGAKPEAKAKKKYTAKPQVYQRGNETHKEIFSGLMKAVAPDWKKTPASKAKAKVVSKVMEGKPFLDADGEVLKDFRLSVKKQMGGKK